MNWPHVHLIINHVPVIGLPLVILLLGTALYRRSDELVRVSLGAFVFIALAAIPVYLTGQAAEETVKDLPGVTENIIGTHEDVASYALVAIEALGIAALAGLIFFRRSHKIPLWFVGAVLVVALGAAAVTGLTANLGGQIRHPEIREGFTPPPATRPARHEESRQNHD